MDAFSEQRCRDFNERISDEALTDLGYMSPKYMWSRGNNASTFKVVRLDHGLCSDD